MGRRGRPPSPRKRTLGILRIGPARGGGEMRDRLGRLREAANMLRTGAPASQDTAKDTDAEELSVLKLALEDIQRENKRLRDARSALTLSLIHISEPTRPY